jgi:hypothetical protein
MFELFFKYLTFKKFKIKVLFNFFYYNLTYFIFIIKNLIFNEIKILNLDQVDFNR